MIDPEVIAAHAYGAEVHSTQQRRHIFLNFSVDDAPDISNTVKPEHLKNRGLVSHGRIVHWGEHGRVAIIESQSGVQAAFHHYELRC